VSTPPPSFEELVAAPLDEALGVGLSVRDLDTGEGEWDAWLKSIFGLPPEAPAPDLETSMSMVLEADRPRVAAALRRMRQGEPNLETAYRIRTPAGEVRHLLSRTTLQVTDAGQRRRVLGVTVDQTAMRRALEQLRDAHERLRLSTESSGIGSWERDLASGQGHWDGGMFRLFGLPPAASAPSREDMLRRVHPQDRATVERAWQSVVAGQDLEYECRIVRDDGTQVQVLARARVLRDPDGRPARAIGTLIDLTEVRQGERERADLLARLRLAGTTAGIGLWERDLGSGAETWDARMRELHGVDGEFVPNLDRWLQQVPPETRAATAAQEARLAGGRPGAYEFTLVRPDGEARTLVRNALLVRDSPDGGARLLGTALDVTEIRRAQRERDDLTARMQLVARTIELGIWDWDLLAEASVWNDQMYALFGRTREQFRDLVWLDVVHPDDVPRARAALQATLASGSTFDIELRVVWPDGSVHWIASRGRVERDAVGNPVRMLGVNFDVTQRHATEAELRDALQRLRLTTASTGIGVWTVDLANGKVQWDEQMRALHGLGSEEVADPARTWIGMTHPDERESVLAAAMSAMQRGEPLEIDVRIVRRDGQARTLAHRAQVQRDADGVPVRLLGVCWDITERRNAEAALREKAAAERASQAKSEFLSRVSHELRTPLNAILGFAQILEIDRKEPLSERQRERIDQIQGAGRHLLALINDVLDLSRIEAGVDKLNVQPTEPLPVIDACLELVATQAAAQGVTVHRPPPDSAPPKVWVDATRLRQVLLNLLSNAIKYNRRGGHVDVQVEPPQAGCLTIRVADTGAGMNDAQMAQLFQPFNRLGREKAPIPGAGIGLAISQRLVEQMGGTLSARSQPSVGSVFTLQLRVAAGAGVAPPPAGAADPAALTVREDIAGSVLYVEDIASNRQVVAEMLALRPRVRLRLAETGAEALQLAAQQRPDAALIDIGLPDISGLDLLGRLRALPELADLPCVAVSANALAHEIEQAIRAGFNDYWTKPLQAGRFLRGVDDLLANRGEARGT
jgi:hypothetical protein